jgi:hypothetical protein
MLLIAVGFGSLGDPFTCSTTYPWDEAVKAGFDPSDAKQCRDYICKDKGLEPQYVDEVMVIYADDKHGSGEPEVQHWHYEFD